MTKYGDDGYADAIDNALGGATDDWALPELLELQQTLRGAQEDLSLQFDERYSRAVSTREWDEYEGWKAQAQRYRRLLVRAVSENGRRIQERQGERTRSKRSEIEERLEQQSRDAANVMFDIVEGRLTDLDEVAARAEAWLVEHRSYAPDR